MKQLLDTGKLGATLGLLEVEVVGKAGTGLLIIGETLIIRCPELNSDVYPFDYLVVPEIFLSDVD
jgi:hypothetical protein